MWKRELVERFARKQFGAGVSEISVTPLRGGLETCGIARVAVFGAGRRRLGSFVVKPLTPPAVRELQVHLAIERASAARQLAPKVLAWRRAGESVYVFMEWIEASARWPWRDLQCATLVMEQLARVHAVRHAPERDWDYDAELRESAATTLATYDAARRAGLRPSPRPMRRALARTAANLGRMRRQLTAYTGASLLHGDAHPGNAIVRRRRGSAEALLLDWGRARLGSPLEDVCGWLQSLGFWEPEARRAHDSLLRRYLLARDQPPELSRHLRDAYWLAGASNAMAGALRYHLAVMTDPNRTPRVREVSGRAAADWLRIVRRAEECWQA